MELAHESIFHSDKVSVVNWAETDIIYTGSFDHTIKAFDMVSKKEANAISLRDSVCTALDKRLQTLISG